MVYEYFAIYPCGYKFDLSDKKEPIAFFKK
jgi:hypothetical protein